MRVQAINSSTHEIRGGLVDSDFHLYIVNLKKEQIMGVQEIGNGTMGNEFGSPAPMLKAGHHSTTVCMLVLTAETR